jgi:Zn-dependent protease
MTPLKHINPHYQQGIKTSRKEIIDLLKAWIVLGLAFAIVMNGLQFNLGFVVAIVVSLIVIGLGFLLHELAHKFVAQHYGCFAEFRSYDPMLFIALLMSFFGFIFAAPGAVMIQGHMTSSQRGKISAAGPGMNIIVALMFLPLIFTGTGIIQFIARYGFMINSWLALFNMIPFGFFDGQKIMAWNKWAYAGMVVLALGLIVIQNLMSMGVM